MDDSFEKIYSEYYTPVYRYIFSMCKNEHTAEEITQEAFFKALKNIEKYDPSQRMLTWLCTIAKNTYFTYVKKEGRKQELARIIGGANITQTTLKSAEEMLDI